MKKNTESLALTKWRCKYHIIFASNIEDRSFMENINKVSVKLFVNYAKEKKLLF